MRFAVYGGTMFNNKNKDHGKKKDKRVKAWGIFHAKTSRISK